MTSSGNGGNPAVPSPTGEPSGGSGGTPSSTGGVPAEPSGGAPSAGSGNAGTSANEGGSNTGGSGSSDAPFTRAETVRVMAFGDSITATGDWRRRFWDKLQGAGYTNIDMVGSGNDGSGNFDGNNEGHSGVLVTNVTAEEINGWATTNPADVVLFHWATNDVWSNVSTNNILEAYTRMVVGLRAGNPNVIVLVAKIIPVAPPSCGDCPARTVNLNDAIPAWAEMTSSTASPVVVIDQWTGFDPATGTEDGVHPYTAIGAQHIADNWYDALIALYQD